MYGVTDLDADISEFLDLTPRARDARSMASVRATYNDVLSAEVLPIANNSGGVLFCLVLDGQRLGAVTHFDMSFDYDEGRAVPMAAVDMRLVAGSFRGFLEKIVRG